MEAMKGFDFRGVVSIEQHRKWIFKQALGEADIANQRYNRLETKFSMAGGSKVFTAVAILKLIEEGKLSLGAKLGSLLPYDLGSISRDITIRQLLNHTSGVGDYFREDEKDSYALVFQDYPNSYVRSARDFLPLFSRRPMQFAPGERFEYSQAGYVLLSLVIEQVCQMPFDAYVDKVIFKPLGMADTGYFSLDCLPGNCATGYCFDPKSRSYFSNIYSTEVKGSGAGGAYSTAADLERFWTALMAGRLLPRPKAREMLSPQVPDGWYGYGVWLKEQADMDDYLPFIQGNQPGVSFISSYDKHKNRSITLMSNFESDVWTLHGKFYSELAE